MGDDTQVVPGVTPATTPPILPSGGNVPGVPGQPGQQAADPVAARTRQILETLLKGAQQKQAGGTPIPQAIPQQGNTGPSQLGFNTGNPHAWGTQRFLANLGTQLRGAVANQKQGQVLKAEGDWSYLQSSLNELYQAQAGGDPKAIAAAQKKVDATLGDPKKLKNMAKALNQDWLNPEKTTVYGEALKNVTKKQQQQDQQNQQKQTAAQKVKEMVMGLVKQKQQLQLTADQQRKMIDEIQAKAPIAGSDPAAQRKLALDTLDIAKAQKDLQENYYPPTPDKHGVLRSVNKNNPNDVVTIRDHETGEAVKGIPKGAAPKPLSAGGVPYGIARNGKLLTPASPEWSKEDQAVLDGAKESAKEKQNLRLAPEIADQIGEPPNPAEYAKGRSDPQYAAALKKYGQEAESIKDREAATSGEARAKAFNQYRPVQVLDENGDVYYTTAKDAIAKGQSGAGEGIKLKSRTAQIGDIEAASKNERSAISNVDKPFDAKQIAKLRLATSTDDPTLANTELAALANDNLTPAQQDFVIWTQQVNERAMALRSVAGLGQGAQDLRSAIRSTLPNLGSGNKEMMTKQLDAFDQQVKVLKGGIAHPGKGSSKADTAKPGFKKNADGSYSEN